MDLKERRIQFDRLIGDFKLSDYKMQNEVLFNQIENT